ncbi:Lrp/AsnC family transcriptional regulator [Candidatus Bathyarchaeota archaeon]|nr:MAG: Lrp/AsnC family transcriptional regulator [Candidatus Bathyarchaeota archaeon]
MITAFILLTVKAGTDQDIIKKLENYKNVKEVYEIYGAYDILVRVEVQIEEELRKIQQTLEKEENVWTVQIVRVVEVWKKET